MPAAKVTKSKESVSSEVDATSVHVGVSCDGCGKSPLSGVRFKCVNCDEFNFCEDCEVKKKQILNFKRPLNFYLFLIFQFK